MPSHKLFFQFIMQVVLHCVSSYDTAQEGSIVWQLSLIVRFDLQKISARLVGVIALTHDVRSQDNYTILSGYCTVEWWHPRKLGASVVSCPQSYTIQDISAVPEENIDLSWGLPTACQPRTSLPSCKGTKECLEFYLKLGGIYYSRVSSCKRSQIISKTSFFLR